MQSIYIWRHTVFIWSLKSNLLGAKQLGCYQKYYYMYGNFGCFNYIFRLPQLDQLNQSLLSEDQLSLLKADTNLTKGEHFNYTMIQKGAFLELQEVSRTQIRHATEVPIT